MVAILSRPHNDKHLMESAEKHNISLPTQGPLLVLLTWINFNPTV